MELSQHAKQVLRERSIDKTWVRKAIESPDRVETGEDGNTHYIKSIAEQGERFLRVVVNTHVTPQRVVTAFFDRRLRRER
ncbi:MAG: DUF4258 domain-containing protein [Candidatus Bipolaricaulota bacterium]